MKQELNTRLERLEQRAQNDENRPCAIFVRGVDPGPEETDDAKILGYESDLGEVRYRGPGESAAALRKRITEGLAERRLFFEIKADAHHTTPESS